MRLGWSWTTIVAGVLTALPAFAQTAPPPPAPAFDLPPFRFLLGRWRGTGVFGPNGKPVSSRMTFAQVNRTTLMVTAAEDPPNSYRYVALLSRERDSGQLVMQMSSSFDGPALFRSGGWTGDRLVFEPAAGIATGASRVRFSYRRTGTQSFDLRYEYSVGGKWLLGDEQHFTRLGDAEQRDGGEP